ncbi:MAG: PilZ domain-containing protein [Aliiglaciecola sp.]|uniref:PilZ domain-containing protein n=1 Tax=Aliiglaciecola sp. M165 TaxID=2593649 RepID=UPI00117D47C1|nr:PilZ domain-containing protein [Aliiglaciecola sp. M165]TRY29529.1 PilZ domain-containing protein [Aliiglaciecola sp. M165]
MDKRQFNRVIYSAHALLKQEGRQWQTDVLDLSLKGALIAYPDEFTADLEKTFELDIEMEGADRHILLEGSIVHSANHCLGFHAEHMDIESMTELRRIVELNLGDETLLHRDLKALSEHE